MWYMWLVVYVICVWLVCGLWSVVYVAYDVCMMWCVWLVLCVACVCGLCVICGLWLCVVCGLWYV